MRLKHTIQTVPGRTMMTTAMGMVGTIIMSHYANRVTMDTLVLVVAVDNLFSNISTMLTASALLDNPTIHSAV